MLILNQSKLLYRNYFHRVLGKSIARRTEKCITITWQLKSRGGKFHQSWLTLERKLPKMSKYIDWCCRCCNNFKCINQSKYMYFSLLRRAANAARAMAALTSSSMSGVFPPIAAAMPMIPSMSSIPSVAKPLSDTSSPADGFDSNENSSSALDQAMAATLAAIEVPELPPKGRSRRTFLCLK